MGKKNKPLISNSFLTSKTSGNTTDISIQIGSQSWYEWLMQHDGFIYEGNTGHFTARRELRRGIGYWYAYRRRDGKLSKVYLGKSANLSQDCLEQACTYLAGHLPIEQLLSKDHSSEYTITLNPPSNKFTSDTGKEMQISSMPLTKIITPALPRNHITRSRLTLRITTPITILCAPSGYGKSALLNEWCGSNGIQVAWVTLDVDDNNPQRFWSMVVAAFQTINANVGQKWLSLLYTTSTEGLSKIVINLTNDIVRVMQGSETLHGIGFVLDNYHQIHNPAVHTSIQTFLDHLPPKLRMVIASQTRPPLEIGKLRSKGLALEIGVDDLRFSLEEGISFISQHAPAKTLAYHDMQKLVKRTKGWISGLVLAITALAQEEGHSSFVESFTGTHPYLREFFIDNVLEQIPPDLKSFLLKTSILEHLSGPICDVVTNRNDSTKLLAQLWQDRLFINYIEEENRYRYDDLFVELLRSQLSEQFPSEFQGLHLKAAKWYAENQAPADSIHHLLNSASWIEAAELIEKVSFQELEKFGEGVRLLRWLQLLPEAVLYQNKTLLILFTRLAMLFLPPSDVERFLTRTEVYFGSSSLTGTSGHSQSTLSEIHKLHRLWLTREKSKSASPHIKEIEAVYQLMDQILIFRRDFRRNLVQAELKANSVYETAQARGNLFAILIAGGACANLAFSQGYFRRSETVAHQVLQHAFKISGKLPESASIALTVLSSIYYERNQNIQAHRLLVRADEVNPNPTSSNEPVMIAILRAKIQSAEGNNNAAFTTIQAARELHSRRPSSIWIDQDLAAYMALFRLQEGDIVAAERHLSEPGGNDIHGFSDLVRAAILMEQKRSVAAEEILYHLIEHYPHGLYWLPILRAQVMLSIALFDQHKVNQACQVMAEAARLAAPEFFVRPFLVSGPRIVSLLSLVLHTENLNAGTRSFLKGILTMLGYEDGTIDIIPREDFAALAIASSITPREQQILRLLSANLSNLDIAKQSSISPSTVKTHLENIYRKLGVNNRSQAISQARILNLV